MKSDIECLKKIDKLNVKKKRLIKEYNKWAVCSVYNSNSRIGNSIADDILCDIKNINAEIKTLEWVLK